MLDGWMPNESLRASLTARAERYAQTIDRAASYLAARGIDRELAASFHLGVVSDPEPHDERFTGMLSIPYLTHRGDVLALKFRRMAGDGPKYDSPSGQKQRLFNARSLVAGGDTAVILEGELDCIIASRVLEVPCVGTPGTNWMPAWTRCFADFERVLVVCDNDVKDDGTNPGRRHGEKLVKQIPNAEMVLPPAGHDFNSWVLDAGADVVRGRVFGSSTRTEVEEIPY